MKAIVVSKYGGPEVLQYTELEAPNVQKGDVRIQQEAIGVNFIDVYHRTGLYPLNLPFIPGSEGAGIIESVDSTDSQFQPGDRVAYAMTPGSYADYAIVPIRRLVKIPEWLGSMRAAAILLQGMTVHYLVYGSYKLQKGDTALIHAAAGGVGLLLVQIAKHLGAFVIGTVSSHAKAELASKAGADEVIIYTESDFLEETMRITKDRGVQVVYDSVGQSTFEKSLECLRQRGSMILFGQSSGPVPPFSPGMLAKKSLFLTRPSLGHYTASPQELTERSNAVFQWLQDGIIQVHIDKTFTLSEAADAHRRLESRESTGKILLIP